MDFDIYALSIMAGRLLDGAEGERPEVALLAVERLADQPSTCPQLASPHARQSLRRARHGF